MSQLFIVLIICVDLSRRHGVEESDVSSRMTSRSCRNPIGKQAQITISCIRSFNMLCVLLIIDACYTTDEKCELQRCKNCNAINLTAVAN